MTAVVIQLMRPAGRRLMLAWRRSIRVYEQAYEQLVRLVRLCLVSLPNRGIPTRIRIAVDFFFGTPARGQLQEPAAL